MMWYFRSAYAALTSYISKLYVYVERRFDVSGAYAGGSVGGGEGVGSPAGGGGARKEIQRRPPVGGGLPQVSCCLSAVPSILQPMMGGEALPTARTAGAAERVLCEADATWGGNG